LEGRGEGGKLDLDLEVLVALRSEKEEAFSIEVTW